MTTRPAMGRACAIISMSLIWQCIWPGALEGAAALQSGNGEGFTVKEVIEQHAITGERYADAAPRRAGDPAVLWRLATRFARNLVP